MGERLRVLGEGFDPFYVRYLTSFWQKLVGLLSQRSPEGAKAVLLGGCGSIHTFGMAYPIDCCFLNSTLQAVRVVRALAPGRLLGAKGAVAVIERAALQGSWIAEGERVVIERSEM